MNCFYCIVEQVRNDELPCLANEAVTEFRGTPVCAIHAKDMADEELRITEEFSPRAVKKAQEKREREVRKIADLLRKQAETMGVKQ